MATITINNNAPGNALQTMLAQSDILPGDAPSYQVCKVIYEYHPMGEKIVGFPVDMAQSQERKISIPKGPEERLVEAFHTEWKAIGATAAIAQLARLAQVYGAASIALLTETEPLNSPVDYDKLYGAVIGFNILDPLNTAGSLVLNQNPTALDFQKVKDIAIAGQGVHRSRSLTLFNEKPIYLGYTTSAFGYVGRSAYQRALFPLKSFLATMNTDDMVALKAGVLVAKMSQQSSVVDKMMAAVSGIKRALLREAQTGNVLNIATDEAIESLDLKNLDGPYGAARKNIIENIATASGRPAKLLLAESFAEGFGEGTEDSKHIAQFIQGLREWMQPAYDYFDKIVRYRAWNADFYKSIQADFKDEYGDVSYAQAFYAWSNSFTAQWPSLIEEPESEKVRVSEAKGKMILGVIETFAPALDPENKAKLFQWAADNINADKVMFTTPLLLDYEALEAYEPQQAAQEPAPPRPFADSLLTMAEAVARLPERQKRLTRVG